MLLLGDSLLKQLFISLACDLSDDVAQSHIEWATEQAPWGCMATHNCIRTGRHSGFHNGSVAFKSGGELHYLELHGTVMRDVVDGLLQCSLFVPVAVDSYWCSVGLVQQKPHNPHNVWLLIFGCSTLS